MVELRVGTLILAFVVVILGLAANMMSWRATMASLGAFVPVRSAARVFFLSQLGKYLPGSVWPVLAQVELAKERGIPRSRSAAAAVVAMLVGVVTSSLLGGSLIFASRDDALVRYWWVLGAIPAGAAVLYPPFLRRLLALTAKILRRSVPDVPVDGRRLVTAVAWSLLMWVLFGLHIWLIAIDIASVDVSILLTTGAYALSWVVGFLVILAPAGVGVRELALVLALEGVLTPAGALALAIASRVLMTVADALFAGLGVLGGRLRVRS